MVIERQLKVNLLSLLLVFTLGTFFVIACQARISGPKDDADDKPPLLTALLQGSDLADEFVLSESSVWHEPITPTLANQDLIENAGRTLWGEYGHERYFIRLTHGLELYKDRVPPATITTPKDWGFKDPESFTPTLKPVGYQVLALCSKEKDTEPDRVATLMCEVTVEYHKVMSRLFLSAVTEMNDQTINDLLDNILSKIDSRVKEIDN